MEKRIAAGVLDVAYEETGPPDGVPVMLLHGFPYDICAYGAVAPILAAAGCRVVVPYLRGYGATRFRAPDTPRSGQQAALAHDLVALMDALAIPSAALAGFDWGGRAACIVAALWPERVRCLVSANGYTIQDIPSAAEPGDPAYAETERRLAEQPPIAVPSMILEGMDNGIHAMRGPAAQAAYFTGRDEHRVIAGAGHNLPQEAPGAFAAAVLALVG